MVCLLSNCQRCGSGTTGIASVKLKRRYIGIDSEEEYCELTKRRYLELQGRGSYEEKF